MALPSTNLGVSDIFYQANPLLSGITDLSFSDIAEYSYFDGPNGANTQPYNYWGEDGTIGAGGLNRIFGTTARADNFPMGDFRGLTYFYDNSNFLVKVDFTNNLPANAPFPPPPTNNDVGIDAQLLDSTLTLQYGVGSGNQNVQTNGGNYNATISQTTSPIIFRGYWKVTISPSAQLVSNALVDITINGTAKVTNGTVNAGPTPTSFDSATYGTEDVASNGTLGGTGLLIVVICHT